LISGKEGCFYLVYYFDDHALSVTMVSTYLVLDRLHLLDSHLPLFYRLPLHFPVFIMAKFFLAIPKSLFEAASIDGAGEWRVFWNIGVPMGRGGLYRQ
jgi:multiple sugar transport system permease protein